LLKGLENVYMAKYSDRIGTSCDSHGFVGGHHKGLGFFVGIPLFGINVVQFLVILCLG